MNTNGISIQPVKSPIAAIGVSRAGAIGKPYSSNHNGGEAIDMKFDPPWGIGKTVKNASGVSVAITSKRDLQEVGATYKVYHWTYHGPKNKVDEPHWSKTGN